jgi:hypothetical protein
VVVGDSLPDGRVDMRFVENVASHDCPNANEFTDFTIRGGPSRFLRRMVGQRFAGVNPTEKRRHPWPSL